MTYSKALVLLTDSILVKQRCVLHNHCVVRQQGDGRQVFRFVVVIVVLKESSFNQIVFVLNKIQVAPGSMDWQHFSYLGKWNLPAF